MYINERFAQQNHKCYAFRAYGVNCSLRNTLGKILMHFLLSLLHVYLFFIYCEKMFIFLYLTIYHKLLHKEIPIVNNVSLSMLCFEMKTNPQKKHMINI